MDKSEKSNKSQKYLFWLSLDVDFNRNLIVNFPRFLKITFWWSSSIYCFTMIMQKKRHNTVCIRNIYQYCSQQILSNYSVINSEEFWERLSVFFYRQNFRKLFFYFCKHGGILQSIQNFWMVCVKSGSI